MSGPEAASNWQRRRVSSGAKKALAPVLALIVALVLALSLATPIAVLAAPASMTVVSDTTTKITEVYNKAGGTTLVVDLSSAPLNAVLAWEPDPYPWTYNSEPPEATGSAWDSGTSDFYTPSGADWIWDTHRTGGPEGRSDDIGDYRYSPESYTTANGYSLPHTNLYDDNAGKWGRVILFEKTFFIPGNVTSATLYISVDNGYEAWINSTWVGSKNVYDSLGPPPVSWEYTLLKQANLDTSGWNDTGNYDITALLSPGINKLEILAGNEYMDSDDGGQNSSDQEFYNPGAVAFLIDIDYEEADLDFGDAPDPSYPTLTASNGAAHVIVPGFFLGASVDADADGQPDATATGDDLDGNDDEDGVAFTSALVKGATANVDVTASASGLLDAWVDFNADGDWSDAGEQVFTNQGLVSGLNSLSFPVPGTAKVGTTFVRFRFSSAGGLSYDGLALDGEVEDYQVEIEEWDFGDAPDPTYPTLAASNGAAHVIVPGFFLGSGVDWDADGQPDPNALGDDNDGTDDEDGVVFTSALVIGGTATVDVTASAVGKLDAWVDFTGDGDWADAGEQIFTNQGLVSGLNSLSFPVPDTAKVGTTFARFRFSSAGGLSYDGLALGGEVEDYEVERPITVGGEVYPIDLDNPTASAPWLVLALILAAGAGILLIRRRRAHQA